MNKLVLSLSLAVFLLSSLSLASPPVVSSFTEAVNGTKTLVVTVFHGGQNETHYLKFLGVVFTYVNRQPTYVISQLNYSDWLFPSNKSFLGSPLEFSRSGGNWSVSFKVPMQSDTKTISFFTKCSVSGNTEPLLVYGQHPNQTSAGKINGSFLLSLDEVKRSSNSTRVRLRVEHADWQNIVAAEVYSNARLVGFSNASQKEYFFDLPPQPGATLMARVYCKLHGFSNLVVYQLKTEAVAPPVISPTPSAPTPSPLASPPVGPVPPPGFDWRVIAIAVLVLILAFVIFKILIKTRGKG